MSGSRPDTWMPMYWGDYLRDTMHLTLEEHGAYLMLIAHYWMNGGPIDASPAYLREVLGISQHKWKKLQKNVEGKFELRGEKLHHRRIEIELVKAKEIYDKRAEAGRKGGQRPKRGFPQDASPASSEASSPASSPAKATTTTLSEGKKKDAPSGQDPGANLSAGEARWKQRIERWWNNGAKDGIWSLDLYGQPPNAKLGVIAPPHIVLLVTGHNVRAEGDKPW